MRQFMSFFSGALVALLVAATLAATPAQATSVTVTTSPQGATVGSLSLVTAQAGAQSTQKAKDKKRATKKKPVWRRALAKARTRAGKPHAYGAAGPNAFDCSGLTSWAYRQAGKKIPRTSSAQAGAAKRVKKPKLGDLVFFHSGGSVYHVGLYAGKGKVFHASKPGVPVGQAKIWTSSVFYGRA